MAQGFDELTPKQRLFVEEYAKDRNGTQAAIRAGYSKKTAESQASRLLGYAKVARAIESLMEKASEKALVDATYVISGLMEVAERCLVAKPVMVWDPANREMAQATNEEGAPVFQFDSNGANKAFELLGKHLGLFTDKLKVEDEGALTILRRKLNAESE